MQIQLMELWLEQGLTLVLNGANLHLHFKTLFLNLVPLHPRSLFLFFTQPLHKPKYPLDSYSHKSGKNSPDIVLLKPDFRTPGFQTLESATHSDTKSLKIQQEMNE